MFKNALRLRTLSVNELCKVAMLVAITVILSYVSGFLRIGNVGKLSISFVSVYVAGAAFGPVIAGVVAALADVVSFLANPTGPFVPWFTMIEFANGFLFGLLLFHGNENKSRYRFALCVVICVLLQYLVNILRTFALAELYYNGNFVATFVMRLPSTTFMAAVKIIVIIAIEPIMGNVIKHMR